MPDLKLFLPAVMLAGGIVLLSNAHDQDRPEPRTSLETIMDTVPGYDFTRQEVDTNSQRVAGMDYYVARVYRRDSLPIWTLYVGYYKYQEQGHTIHSPRNCLPGAGWEPVEQGTLRVDAAQAGGSGLMNKYVLANKGQYAAVYYWYQGRGRIEHDEYRVKFNLLRDAAVLGRTEESLVRLVVPLDTRENRSTDYVKKEIARADSLAMALSPRLAREVTEMMPAGPGE